MVRGIRKILSLLQCFRADRGSLPGLATSLSSAPRHTMSSLIILRVKLEYNVLVHTSTDVFFWTVGMQRFVRTLKRTESEAKRKLQGIVFVFWCKNCTFYSYWSPNNENWVSIWSGNQLFKEHNFPFVCGARPYWIQNCLDFNSYIKYQFLP